MAKQNVPTKQEIEKRANEIYHELAAPVMEGILRELCAEGGVLHKYVNQLVHRGILSEVYQGYYNIYTRKPDIYKRRGNGGGLSDPKNVVMELNGLASTGDVVNGTVDVWNKTPSGFGVGGYAETGILSGTGYKYYKGTNTYGDFRKPRNFYSVFENEFQNSYVERYVQQAFEPYRDRLVEQAVTQAIAEYGFA